MRLIFLAVDSFEMLKSNCSLPGSRSRMHTAASMRARTNRRRKRCPSCQHALLLHLEMDWDF